MVNNIINLFRSIISNDYIIVSLLSVMPLIEVRGAVPVAVAMQLNPYLVVLISSLVGTLAVIPNMIFVKPILDKLKDSKLYLLVDSFEKEVLKKGKKINTKSNTAKYISLALFVALPMVFSGAYTGSTIAVFMGLNTAKSLASILIGNVLSSTIMLVLSMYFVEQIDVVVEVVTIIFAATILVYVSKIIYTYLKYKNLPPFNHQH